MWDIQTPKLLFRVEHPTGEGFLKDVIISTAFSPDGKYIATSFPASANGWGDTILWDAQNGNFVQKFRIKKGMYVVAFPYDYVNNSICFSKDGNFLYTVTSSGAVRKWDIKTGVELSKFDVGSGNYASLLPEENRILIDGSIYSLFDGRRLFSVEGALFLTVDSKLLQIEGNAANVQGQYRIIELDIDSYDPIHFYPVFSFENGNFILSPQGTYVYHKDRIINVHESTIIDSISSLFSMPNSTTEINNIIFSNNEKYLFISSSSNIYIYDVSDLTSGVKNAEALER